MIVGPAAVKHCGMLQTHAAIFEQVANTSNTVIASRALNPLCESLLQEGHASKGFYIKAKSCDWGPMAGLVLANPKFTKDPDTAKQQKYVTKAITDCGPPVDVFISSSRLQELTNLGIISQTEKIGTPKATEIKIKATSSHAGTMNFVARRENRIQEPIWQIFLVTVGGKEEPVKGLKNKSVTAAGAQPIGPRSVVAGDYDLFAVWGKHHNSRALGTGPNVVNDRAKASKVADPYIDNVKKANGSGGSEDPDMGNVSCYVRSIIKKLNAGIIDKTGYQGGSMIHHNDESGNPFTPGEDYPLIFFIPGVAPRAVCNAHELRATYTECEKLGYAVERNPGFSV